MGSVGSRGQGSDQGSHLTSGLFITWALAVQACSRADYGSESLRTSSAPKGMSREEGLLSSSGPSPPRDLASGLFSSSTHVPLQVGEPTLWGLFLMQRLGCCT